MSLNNRLEELNQDLIKANRELQEFLKKDFYDELEVEAYTNQINTIIKEMSSIMSALS